jgi:hypothetical protein
MTRLDTLVKTELHENDVFIGSNLSIYSYDDSYGQKDALLIYRDDTKKIELVIYELFKNCGINKFENTVRKPYAAGTLLKPDLAHIRNVLKEKSYRSGTAGTPFKGKWCTPRGLDANLSEIMIFTKNYLKIRNTLV